MRDAMLAQYIIAVVVCMTNVHHLDRLRRSAVLASCTAYSLHTQTDHAMPSVAIARICILRMRCELKRS